VVVAANPAVAAAWRQILDDVVQSVPARAIVVGLEPDGPDGLDAEVSGVCAPSGGDGAPAVCSEVVSLRARGAVCARVPSVVGSLCLSDVTTTLVWLGRVHTDDPAFAPLAADAGRIVLDASVSPTTAALASLANVVYWVRARAVAERPGVADLAWTRISAWQELCARMFDEPRLRSLASRVTAVTVTQVCEAGAPLGAEGGLLLAWLATRLGWKAASLAGQLRLLRADGVPVRVALRSRGQVTPDEARQTLHAVSLEAGDAGLSMTASVVRQGEAATWTLDVASAARDQGRDGPSATTGERTHLEQRVRLVTSETARLLERTLRRPIHDEALLDAVAWADQLRGEELACA